MAKYVDDYIPDIAKFLTVNYSDELQRNDIIGIIRGITSKPEGFAEIFQDKNILIIQFTDGGVVASLILYLLLSIYENPAEVKLNWFGDILTHLCFYAFFGALSLYSAIGDISKELLFRNTYKLVEANFDGLRFNVDKVNIQCSFINEVYLPEGVKHIKTEFAPSSYLTYLQLPKSIKSIEANSFLFAYDLKEIHYKGTKKDWRKIAIHPNAFSLSKIEKIICSDGIVEITAEQRQ